MLCLPFLYLILNYIFDQTHDNNIKDMCEPTSLPHLKSSKKNVGPTKFLPYSWIPQRAQRFITDKEFEQYIYQFSREGCLLTKRGYKFNNMQIELFY